MNAGVLQKLALHLLSVGILALSVSMIVLALLAAFEPKSSENKVKTIFALFFAAKANFDLVLLQRAVLLYRGVKRPMGMIGYVIIVLVSSAVACSFALISARVRHWLFSEPSSNTLNDAQSLIMSATVIIDVGVVVTAVKLYITPIEDAVHVARAAGLRGEAARFREVLTRHLALCALAVISSCWTWSALVFVPVPAICLCIFFAWWHNLRSRGSRLDALDAIAALVLRDSWAMGQVDATPRTPGLSAVNNKYITIRDLCGILLAAILGLAIPIAIARYVYYRSLLARAPFVVWDTANHAILVVLFLRKFGQKKSPLPTVRDITPSRNNSISEDGVAMPGRGPSSASDNASDNKGTITRPGEDGTVTVPKLPIITEESSISTNSTIHQSNDVSSPIVSPPLELSGTVPENNRKVQVSPPLYPRQINFAAAANDEDIREATKQTSFCPAKPTKILSLNFLV